MAGLNIVESVESISFNMSGAATFDQALTKGQVAENCVPFRTAYVDSGMAGYSYRYSIDCTITGTNATFHAQRSTTASTPYVQAYVVEFDPTEVKVLSGDFEMVSTSSTTATISGVDTSKAMLLCYWESHSGSRGLDAHAVRFYFDTTVSGVTDIHFERGSTESTLRGHYYVVEDLNDNFDVEHFTWSTTGGSYYREWPTTHNLNKTMFISSYYVDTTDENPQHNFVWTYIRNDHAQQHQRAGTSSTMWGADQRVKFNVGDDVRMTTRRYVYQDGSTATTDTDFENGYYVDLDYSMVYNPMLYGTGYSYSGGSSEGERNYHRMSLVSSGTVRMQREETSGAVYNSYEVVDWRGTTRSGVDPEEKHENLVAIDSMVRSIEAIDVTSTYFWYEHPLTKGQDLSNCVPFITWDSSSPASSIMFNDVYFLEPDIIRFSNDGAGTRNIKGSVVEFEPDQVRVQQGEFYTSGTSASVTISGVDLDKAALKFYWQVTDGSYPDSTHYVRGMFATASGLQFDRYDASGVMKGTWYVFEALDDQFSVQSGLNSFAGSGATPNISSPTAYRHRSFPIMSYYYDSTDQNPQHKMVYGYTPSRGQITFSRQGTGGNIYGAWFIITMKGVPGRLFCQHSNSYMASGGQLSDEVTIYEEVNPETAMVAHNVTFPSGYTGEGTSSLSHGAVANLEITSSGIVTAGRANGNNYAYHQYVVTDWAGVTISSGTRTPTTSTSFLNSFEHIEFDLDNQSRVAATTKGQNLDNCVPFLISHTPSYTGGGLYQHKPEVMFEDDIIHMKTNTNSYVRKVHLYLVEFNPLRTKVQQGKFVITSTETTATIEEVDLDRAFLVFNYYCQVGGNNWTYFLVRGQFTSSTELTFDRGAASGPVFGSWWVVESLDESFLVTPGSYSGSSSGGGSGEKFIDGAGIHNTMILMSTKKDSNTDANPQHSAFRGYLYSNPPGLTAYFNRQSSSTTHYDSTFHVTFADHVGVSTQHRYQVNLTGTTLTTTEDIFQVDTERAMLFSAPVYSNARNDAGSASQCDKSFHMYEFTTSGTQVACTAGNPNSSVNTYGAYEIVEWPAPVTRYVDGYVAEKDVPVARVLYMYDRATGELISSTTSRASDGYYSLSTTVSGEHFIVALDDDSGETYNALVNDRIESEEL
jgi:hypothetical protein